MLLTEMPTEKHLLQRVVLCPGFFWAFLAAACSASVGDDGVAQTGTQEANAQGLIRVPPGTPSRSLAEFSYLRPITVLTKDTHFACVPEITFPEPLALLAGENALALVPISKLPSYGTSIEEVMETGIRDTQLHPVFSGPIKSNYYNYRPVKNGLFQSTIKEANSHTYDLTIYAISLEPSATPEGMIRFLLESAEDEEKMCDLVTPMAAPEDGFQPYKDITQPGFDSRAHVIMCHRQNQWAFYPPGLFPSLKWSDSDAIWLEYAHVTFFSLGGIQRELKSTRLFEPDAIAMLGQRDQYTSKEKVSKALAKGRQLSFDILPTQTLSLGLVFDLTQQEEHQVIFR